MPNILPENQDGLKYRLKNMSLEKYFSKEESDYFIDLMLQIIVYNKNDRIKIGELCKHPFFKIKNLDIITISDL